MHPNILIFMTDQMQGRVLELGHPCICPTYREVAESGVRIRRAYTPNPVCSPARASMMTGLLPHSHGVLQVTQCVPEGTARLRDCRHWAQALSDAGYRTGYFGKWHVEHSESPQDYGWQTVKRPVQYLGRDRLCHSRQIGGENGYVPSLFCGVTEAPIEERHAGLCVSSALDYLAQIENGDSPWCVMVSVFEPHDPFVCGKEAFARYDVDNIPVADSDTRGCPGLYRKAAAAFAGLTHREKQEAVSCYYAMITEVDSQLARLMEYLKASGQRDNTLVVLVSDHGELLGAHGLYYKNVGAFEEVYSIPMVFSGPGVAKYGTVDARVGLQDFGVTLTEMCGVKGFSTDESSSFAPLLKNPEKEAVNYTTGYAEYYGTRYWFSQRVYWDGNWKLVWNGFDFDELYHLQRDPEEQHNRIHDPACSDIVDTMMIKVWTIVEQTHDEGLLRSGYPCLHLAPRGPGKDNSFKKPKES